MATDIVPNETDVIIAPKIIFQQRCIENVFHGAPAYSV